MNRVGYKGEQLKKIYLKEIIVLIKKTLIFYFLFLLFSLFNLELNI